MARVAVVGGHGKTGRAVCAGLDEAVALGRADWPELPGALAGCEAAYVIAPNLHGLPAGTRVLASLLGR